MKTLKKQDLAQWLVNENNDCGEDTYFSENRRTAMGIDDSFKKFMKMTKDELISIIYVFSEEGQKFLEEKSYLKTSTFYIWNTKTDESFDTYEMRFYSASWGVELEEKSYLKTLMASNPEKFENCIIVDINAK